MKLRQNVIKKKILSGKDELAKFKKNHLFGNKIANFHKVSLISVWCKATQIKAN